MITKLTTAPALLVSVNTLKDYLKLDISTDDTLLTSIIKSATEDVETYLNRKLNPQTWTTYYEMIDADQTYCYPDQRIPLPFEPVKSITSVKDQDGAVVSYRTIFSYPTMLELAQMPSESLVIVAEFGYDSGKIPERLLLAVQELASMYYEFRYQSIPDEIKAKIQQFRVLKI